SVYFRVVFERHELQHQDTLCVRFHIVEYLVHSAVNAARLLCDFVSAQQRYTVCEYVEQPVPSRRLMRYRRSTHQILIRSPALPLCIRNRPGLRYDENRPDSARNARQNLDSIHECGLSAGFKFDVQFPIAFRRYILNYSSVQPVRTACLRQRIQVLNARRSIHVHREHTRSIAAAARIATPKLGFGEIEMQLVSPLPERDVVLEGAGSLRS